MKAIFPPQEIGETLGRHKADPGEGEGGAEKLHAGGAFAQEHRPVDRESDKARGEHGRVGHGDPARRLQPVERVVEEAEAGKEEDGRGDCAYPEEVAVFRAEVGIGRRCRCAAKIVSATKDTEFTKALCSFVFFVAKNSTRSAPAWCAPARDYSSKTARREMAISRKRSLNPTERNEAARTSSKPERTDAHICVTVRRSCASESPNDKASR